MVMVMDMVSERRVEVGKGRREGHVIVACFMVVC